MSNIDIKKVIESIATKNNPQVYNNVAIKNVSVVATKDSNVRYWVILTLDKPIRGSYVKSVENEVPNYAIGLTTTVMVPIGTITTVLFDSLFEIDDDTEAVDGNTVEDCASDLLSVKKALVADFEKMAAKPTHRSAIASLLIKAKINVISRDVFKEDGKIKSLFALNEKEVEVVRDSVWHDVYDLSDIRTSKIVSTWKQFCANAPAASDAPVAQPAQSAQPAQTPFAAQPALAAFLAALAGNSNAAVAQNALG